MSRETENGVGLVLRWWHLVSGIVTGLVLLGVLYGTMSARMAQHEDHLKVLDEHSVTKEQFEEMRQDLRERLQRIERKIDDDALRNADPPARKKF